VAPSFSVMYSYVRSRQLENTYSSDPKVGAWVVTAMRFAHGWGAPPESAWPYDGDASHWPPTEPPGVDELARKMRVGAYQRVRSLDECRICLASQHPVQIAIRATSQWFSAPSGVIEFPTGGDDFVGSHSVLVVGYDDGAERLKIMNSWGEHWGDHGYGYLPYDYFKLFLQEAWMITTPYDSQPESRSKSGGLELEWGVPDIFGGVLHGVEIYSSASDDYLGWGFGVVRDGCFDVEELFVKPNNRRTGIGTRLASLLSSRASALNLPIRLWVPHADVNSSNLATFARLVKRLGLTIKPSDALWASYAASTK